MQGGLSRASGAGREYLFDELPVSLVKAYHRAFFVVRAFVDL
jgi:hypothetical protein